MIRISTLRKTLGVVLLFITLSAFTCSTLQAQYGMEVSPRLSHAKGTLYKIGYTEINIRYSGPTVKNRKIWGELVPYDQVWRAGANNATTIEFNYPVVINGQPLEAGKYGFFIIPKEHDRWTLIFNSVHDQWGAFNYDESKDVLRTETLPVITQFTEELTYLVESKGSEFGTVYLQWDRYKIGFEVQTNHLDLVENALKNSLKTAKPALQWVTYVEGADYLVRQNGSIEKGLEWIATAEKELAALKDPWNPNYMPKEYIMGHMYWLKALLMARKGDYENALASAEQMKKLEGGYLFYPTQKESQNIDKQLTEWKSQVD